MQPKGALSALMQYVIANRYLKRLTYGVERQCDEQDHLKISLFTTLKGPKFVALSNRYGLHRHHDYCVV